MRITPSILSALVPALGTCLVSGQAPPADPNQGAEGSATAVEGAGPDQALARFDSGQITPSDLRAAIARMPPAMAARYADPELKRALYEQTLRFALLAQEAERRGHGERPETQRAVEECAVQRLIRERIDEQITPESLSDADVAAFYEAHNREFNRPELRRASHIQVPTVAAARQLLKQLRGVDLRAFRRAAQEKSTDDATKLRGGDLRYFDAGGAARGGETTVPEALARAAFEIEGVGGLYPKPIAREEGYSVLMLTGQRDEVAQPLAEAEDVVRRRLVHDQRREALDALVGALKAELNPTVNAELIALIDLDVDDGPPVARGPGIPPDFPTGAKANATKVGENAER